MSDKRQGRTDPDDHLGWKPSWMHRRDGRGGWTVLPAQVQFLHWLQTHPYFEAQIMTVPYGVARMGNGQIIVVGSVGDDKSQERVVAAFSDDGRRIAVLDESNRLRRYHLYVDDLVAAACAFDGVAGGESGSGLCSSE